MQPEDFEILLERYIAGSASSEERAIVETWALNLKPDTDGPSHQQLLADQQESLKQLLNHFGHKKKRKLLPMIVAAASVLILLSYCTLILFKPPKQQKLVVMAKSIKKDIAPGSNKATITLANGNIIQLTGAKNGTLATVGNTRINKISEGLINYQASHYHAISQYPVYNTATTPRGGQYQLILADGTKVWLNSASSIKFPVVFTGNERRVELTGEAYFEVTHHADKPFKVVLNGQVIEDLGTSFNINAYDDEEDAKTTLVEGSIKISSGAVSRVIKPGEQARLKQGQLSVTVVNPDEALAWKNGFFHFDNNTIQEVTRQLSRWYDVDIKFEGQIPTRHFSGEISRNVSVSQLLDILSFKKIHYKIEGKAVVVMP